MLLSLFLKSVEVFSFSWLKKIHEDAVWFLVSFWWCVSNIAPQMSGVVLYYYSGFSVCALESICQLKLDILLTRLIFIGSYLKFFKGKKNILYFKK